MFSAVQMGQRLDSAVAGGPKEIPASPNVSSSFGVRVPNTPELSTLS